MTRKIAMRTITNSMTSATMNIDSEMVNSPSANKIMIRDI